MKLIFSILIVSGPLRVQALVPDLIEALKLPTEQRIQTLQVEKSVLIPKLQALGLDNTQPLQVRWRALTSLGHMNNSKVWEMLESNLKQSEWFVRNASLIALQKGPRKRALNAAEKLMDDPALVVRTAAVQVISQLKGSEKSEILWKKLFSSENYRNGESLWIRKHIAQALSQFAKPGSQSHFRKMLEDSDPEIHEIAIATVERLMGQSLSKEYTSREQVRRAWLSRLGSGTKAL